MQINTSTPKQTKTQKIKAFLYHVRRETENALRTGASDDEAMRAAIAFAHGFVTAFDIKTALLLAAAVAEEATAHSEAAAIRKMAAGEPSWPVTELSQGEPEFRAAMAEAGKSCHGLVWYRHGVGFGHSAHSARNVDWCAAWDSVRDNGFFDIRSYILAALNVQEI